MDGLTPCFLERGKLQGGVLVVGAGSGISYFHAPILKQTYETFKPLILKTCVFVSKLTLCATGGKISARLFVYV